MTRMLRIAALFAAYGTIAWSGDRAVGLLAQEIDARFGTALEARFGDREAHRVAVHTLELAGPEVATAAVVVDVRPSVVARVRVRHGSECAYEAQRELSVPVDGSGSLSLDAGAGELHVEGREGLEEIVVVGTLCASHRELFEELDVRADRRGSAVHVETVYPDQRGGWEGRRVARIDLTVLVPRGLAADVEDSSGNAEIFGTGDLSVDDSSGDLRVWAVEGRARIDDSSGSLEVEDVSGDLEIDDSSGGLDVRRVGGSLVMRDGSGGIDIVSVQGDVVIESDGSGGIDVRDVGGDFVVASDGSGGIRHSGVEGRVRIPRKRR